MVIHEFLQIMIYNCINGPSNCATITTMHPPPQRQCRLSRDKWQALERLDFPWSLQEEKWNDKFQQLCRFKETHGHFRVPLLQEDETTRQLAVWVNNQRRQYRHLRQGRNSTLTPNDCNGWRVLTFSNIQLLIKMCGTCAYRNCKTIIPCTITQMFLMIIRRMWHLDSGS